MGGAPEKRQRLCTHLGALKHSQLQHSLLRHCAARQAAGLPPLPLGDGLLCLGCGATCASVADHADAGPRQQRPCPGRELLLDLRNAELYCPACCDYVFDREFDLALQTAMAAPKSGAARGGSVVTGHDEAPASGAAAQQQHCSNGCSGGPAAVAADALRALAEGFASVAPDGFPAGLRGLNNLGNTCFMNSVLQALLHAPLLRNHYLLNRHSHAGCSISADGGYCVNCELDGVFSAAYSGRRAGFSPAQFLYTWWMLAGGHMAGYQQQDAHEFFCFILEMMSATSGAECITRSVFGGTLRSDVICSACGHVSTSHEQFSHLSLDIPQPQQLIAPTILARPTGGSQATALAGGGGAGTAAAKSAKAGSGGKAGGSKKAGGGSGRAAAAAAVANGASKGSKLVGAAKLSHERALARKAAEAAASAAAGDGSNASALTLPDQSAAATGLAGAGPPQPQQQHHHHQQSQQQQQQEEDMSSEPEMIDLCASDSMSLGASVGGFGGMLGQSGLEAASGVHMGGAGLTVDDDAMDTLSSPRQQLMGALPEMLLQPGSPFWTSQQPPVALQAPAAQQQQAQQAQRQGGGAGGARRPPIPPGSRSGRVGPQAAAGAATPGGRKGGAGAGAASSSRHAALHQQHQQQEDSGSPEADPALQDASGLSTAAAAQAAAMPAGMTGLQDSLAAATNLPGTQNVTAAAGAAVVAALPPQLAGYYRWPGASLLGCLNRFTRAEQLGTSEKWVCDRCASGRHAVKQLSLRRLPPLLVFHAKRFEHAGGLRAVAKKLDTYLSFPLRDLDMRPYLASAVLRSRFRLPPPAPGLPHSEQLGAQQQQQQQHGTEEGAALRRTRIGGSRRSSGSLGSLSQPQPLSPSQQHQQQQRGAGPSPAAPAAHAAAAAAADEEAGEGAEVADPSGCLYDLYAVVCHRGSFQGGHYVAYVKAADQRWYLCDDAWITAADEEAVRNCQAYMLFYSQRRLLEAREPAAAAGAAAAATGHPRGQPPRHK